MDCTTVALLSFTLIFSTSYVPYTSASKDKSHQMNSWLTGNYDYGSSPEESPPTPPDNPVQTQQHSHPQQHQNQQQTFGHLAHQNQGQHQLHQTHGQHSQQVQDQHQPHQTQGHHNQQGHHHQKPGHHQQQQNQHHKQPQAHAVAPVVPPPAQPKPSQGGESRPQQQPLAHQQPASYHQKEVQLTQVNYPETPAKQIPQTQQLQGNHPPPAPPQFPNNILPNYKEHGYLTNREMIEEKPQNKQRNEVASNGNAWLFGLSNPVSPSKSLQDEQKYEEELKKRKTKWDFDKEDDEKRKTSGFTNYKDKIVEITKTHEKRPDLMGEGNRIQNGHLVMLGPNNGGYQPIPQVPHAGPPSPPEGNQFQVPDGYYKGKIIHDPNFKFMDVTYGPLPSKQRPPHGNKGGKRHKDERRKPFERYPKQVQPKSEQSSSGYLQSVQSPPVGGHGEHLMEDPPAEIIYEYGWYNDNRNHACLADSHFITILIISTFIVVLATDFICK